MHPLTIATLAKVEWFTLLLRSTMTPDEVVAEYRAMNHDALSSYPSVLPEFDQLIRDRNFRGAWALVEKATTSNGMAFTPPQDRVAERFFFFLRVWIGA